MKPSVKENWCGRKKIAGPAIRYMALADILGPTLPMNTH